ncbi:MAG: electron transfer flavoprotein subunit alpha [Candidatus Solibacter sp.]
METLLVLAHTEPDGTLAKPALEALAAALALGGPVTLGLAGALTQPAADQIATCGAVRFLSIEGAAFAAPRYATDAAAAEALCRAANCAIVIAAGTSRWARALPGVAWRLGGRVDTHATGIAAQGGEPSLTRWFYRQRMEATLSRTQRPWIVLLDPGCVSGWNGAPGAATVETVALEAPATRTTVTGYQAPKSNEQTIRPDARMLLVAGAGWTKKQADGAVHTAEAEQLILGFLRKAQASLGSSKSLVDQSGEGQAVLTCLSHMNQIGQTGSTPRHAKGLSTCCHGEEPHVVGWRFVNQRRAINLDAACGWARGKADVLYVADAFEVMRHLVAML